MAKKSKKKKKSIFLPALIIILLAFIVFGGIGYCKEIVSKYKEKKHLEKELIALKEKEKELKLDADKLQDPDYVARYAREKYFYSKDGEYVIKIPEEDE